MLWLWVFYGFLGIGVLAFAFHFLRTIRTHISSGQGFSLSDYLALAGTALNVVLLLVAVVALHVAVSTYRDAKRSGEEQGKALQASRDALADVTKMLDKQENTLEASRKALDSSVTAAVAQQNLLSEGVEN